MKYGIIDTSTLTKRPEGYVGHTPNELSLGASMAMPGVERDGKPRKRDGVGFAAALAALYTAHGFEWAFNGCKPRNDKALGYTNGSNKHNHETGLRTAGLITTVGTQKSGGEYVMLTDLGVDRCKAVSPELGKLAKQLTLAAFEKAQRAAEKAAKASAKPAGEFNKPAATEVAAPTDNSTSEAPEGFDEVEAELITADQVEAMQQSEADAA